MRVNKKFLNLNSEYLYTREGELFNENKWEIMLIALASLLTAC